MISEHSRRPAMAFVSFTCEAAAGGAGEALTTPAHVITADNNDVVE